MHKTQKNMQTSGKGDDVGWPVFEVTVMVLESNDYVVRE
jgi:hypothetical protein